ncbi:WYL domain-containing protein [Pseudomonas sp. S31]|uniref:helix-turn-helix transcriptional regulator n=1 Tax=Pseudomonas sp. S31 TaxID=1564473 RepID=UPI001913AD58|nr:WYL domain-containing protein [Pseudomonas sp. S31]MBK4999924.1 WYL domain-containing protein [Pseudomonas sp. S31]
MKRKQSIAQVRWDLALRYRLIETVAWWEGRLTTGHLMQSFGISRQQASKDINTYIAEHASRNLTYDKRIKGYVPTPHFKPRFIDLSASAYLDMLAQNNERAPHIEGLKLAYAHTLMLQVPDRSIQPEVLRPLLRACREGLRLEVEYVSLANPEPEIRLIEPHTLIHTGMRWHVRAYCEKNSAYRDFVLSRIRGKPDLLDGNGNGIDGDTVWNTEVSVILEPDPRLDAAQKAIIEADYGMLNGRLEIPSRQALVKYLLQRYQIDPKNLDPKPEAQQVVIANLNALKPWLYD